MTFENVHESKSISKQNMLRLILHACDCLAMSHVSEITVSGFIKETKGPSYGVDKAIKFLMSHTLSACLPREHKPLMLFISVPL